MWSSWGLVRCKGGLTPVKGEIQNGQTHSRLCFIQGMEDNFVLASGRHRNPPLGGLKNKSRIKKGNLNTFANCRLSLTSPVCAQQDPSLRHSEVTSRPLASHVDLNSPWASELTFLMCVCACVCHLSFYYYPKTSRPKVAWGGRGLFHLTKGCQAQNSSR